MGIMYSKKAIVAVLLLVFGSSALVLAEEYVCSHTTDDVVHKIEEVVKIVIKDSYRQKKKNIPIIIDLECEYECEDAKYWLKTKANNVLKTEKQKKEGSRVTHWESAYYKMIADTKIKVRYKSTSSQQVQKESSKEQEPDISISIDGKSETSICQVEINWKQVGDSPNEFFCIKKNLIFDGNEKGGCSKLFNSFNTGIKNWNKSHSRKWLEKINKNSREKYSGFDVEIYPCDGTSEWKKSQLKGICYSNERTVFREGHKRVDFTSPKGNLTREDGIMLKAIVNHSTDELLFFKDPAIVEHTGVRLNAKNERQWAKNNRYMKDGEKVSFVFLWYFKDKKIDTTPDPLMYKLMNKQDWTTNKYLQPDLFFCYENINYETDEKKNKPLTNPSVNNKTK